MSDLHVALSRAVREGRIRPCCAACDAELAQTDDGLVLTCCPGCGRSIFVNDDIAFRVANRRLSKPSTYVS
jgi:hypothetical protein